MISHNLHRSGVKVYLNQSFEEVWRSEFTDCFCYVISSIIYLYRIFIHVYISSCLVIVIFFHHALYSCFLFLTADCLLLFLVSQAASQSAQFVAAYLFCLIFPSLSDVTWSLFQVCIYYHAWAFLSMCLCCFVSHSVWYHILFGCPFVLLGAAFLLILLLVSPLSLPGPVYIILI